MLRTEHLCPQNSPIGILTPTVMVLGGAALGGVEGGALVNGVSALINGTPQSFLHLPLCEDTVRRLPSGNPPQTQDLQAP